MKRTSWKDRRDRKHLSLDRNENFDFELRRQFHDFFGCLRPEDLCLYPDLSKAYKALEMSTGISADKILLSHGSEQGLKLLFEALRPIIKIAFCEPTFQMVSVYSEIYGCFPTVKEFKYKDGKFQVDTNITNHDAVYIANPNNPTGTAVPNKSIERLCRDNTWVIIDEAYYEYNNYKTCVELVNKHENLFVLRTLSKACGGAGVRVGYIVTNPVNIETISAYKPAYELSSIAVKFVQYICDNPDMIEESVSRLQKCKRAIEKKYYGIPCKGNYVLIPFSRKTYAHLINIADVKMLTIDNSKFIRVTVTDVEI